MADRISGPRITVPGGPRVRLVTNDQGPLSYPPSIPPLAAEAPRPVTNDLPSESEIRRMKGGHVASPDHRQFSVDRFRKASPEQAYRLSEGVGKIRKPDRLNHLFSMLSFNAAKELEEALKAVKFETVPEDGEGSGSVLGKRKADDGFVRFYTDMKDSVKDEILQNTFHGQAIPLEVSVEDINERNSEDETVSFLAGQEVIMGASNYLNLGNYIKLGQVYEKAWYWHKAKAKAYPDTTSTWPQFLEKVNVRGKPRGQRQVLRLRNLASLVRAYPRIRFADMCATTIVKNIDRLQEFLNDPMNARERAFWQSIPNRVVHFAFSFQRENQVYYVAEQKVEEAGEAELQEYQASKAPHEEELKGIVKEERAEARARYEQVKRDQAIAEGMVLAEQLDQIEPLISSLASMDVQTPSVDGDYQEDESSYVGVGLGEDLNVPIA